MLPSELFSVEWLEPIRKTGGRLPLLAAPIIGEALSAWLHRFAVTLEIPPAPLLLDTDADKLPGDDTWWRHPSLDVLVRVAARCGTKVVVLKTMTFIDWQADRWTDEVMRRFSRGRVRGKPLPAIATRRYGLCLQCLKSDAVPHLRKHWTLGWVVACEKHRVRLHSTCQQCWAGFMLPLLKNNLRFDIDRCPRQGCEMSVQRSHAAHPAALRLQASLIAGRSAGAVYLPSIGRLEWPIAVALIDFVLSIAWTPTEHNVRRRCYEFLERELDCEGPLKGSCHDGLTIAGWILEEWPARLRWFGQALKAAPVKEQLGSRVGLEPQMRERLMELICRQGNAGVPSLSGYGPSEMICHY